MAEQVDLPTMRDVLGRSWWVPLVRGIFAIIFGLLAIFNPAEAIEALTWVFGIYVLMDGALTIYDAIAHRQDDRLWQLLEGIIEVLAGIAAIVLTPLAVLTMVIIIGIWAIVTGVLQIYAAWRIRNEVKGEVFLGLAGLLSILVGFFFIFDPSGGALSLILVIGIYSIIFGVLMILAAFRYRGLLQDEAVTA